MKRMIPLTTAFILAISFILAVTAQAGQFRGGHHGHGPGGGGFLGMRVLKQLDLSSEQKQEVYDILQKYEKQRQEIGERMQEQQRQMAAVLSADTFNEAAIRQACQESAAVREEAFVLRARIFTEIKAVLTPEQREELAADQRLREERMAAWKKKGQSRRTMLDEWLQKDSQ